MKKITGTIFIGLFVVSTLLYGCAGTYGGGTARTPEEKAAMEQHKKDVEKERERENKEMVRDVLDSGMD